MSSVGRVIAGDVGGTKTLLRCVEPGGGVSAERRYDSGRYAGFNELLREFLTICSGPIDAACFAVAGAVYSGVAEVTNLNWQIDAALLERTFGIPRVALINDFYAVALGVPLLRENDLVSLQRGHRDRTSPMAILGAGTGLGEVFVTHHAGAWIVVPTEGGHADFAPQNEEQTRIFLWLLDRHPPHVSWERLVSGMGLQNIYEFLTGRKETPAAISELAGKGDALAVKTFEVFVDIYGAEAGNKALQVLARGGVFLAGGIAAKNIAHFTDGRFITAFLRKGRFSEILREFPVDVIINEQVGLLGAIDMAFRLALESHRSSIR
jgi:glucokinase